MKDNTNILKATGWAFGAEFAAKIVVPITNMILARVLVPEAFGIVVTINMVVSFAEMFTGSSFQKYLIQHEFNDEIELNNSASVAFWANFFISVVALSIIIAFNKKIATLVGSEGYGTGIIVACLALPLTSLSSIYDGINRRKFNFRLLFIIRILVCLVPLLVTLPLALLGFGYWSLIVGTLFGHALRNIIFLLYKRSWFPSFYFDFFELKKMFSFGIWTLLESIISWLITWVDVFFVSSWLNPYYTGLYKTSQSTVSSTLSIITASIQPVLFSHLSRCQNNAIKFKTEYINYVNYTSMFLIPAGVGMFAYSDFITKVLLGDQWLEASDFIGLWALCSALVCLFGELNREAYKAMNKPKVSFYVQLSHLVFIIPICLYAVRLGFTALTIIRPLASLEVIAIHLICTRFVLKVRLLEYFKGMIIPAISTCVMYVFSLVMKHLLSYSMFSQAIQILLCICVYFGFMYIFPSYRKIILGFIKYINGKVCKKKVKTI